ncbi:hypothetical protein ES703_89964 [subsurface metagenome]
MVDDFVSKIKSDLDSVRLEIEGTPAAERVPLLYILGQYQAGVVDFAEYCAKPHNSPVIPRDVLEKVEEMMHGLNTIGSDVGYWIGEIREKASKTGVMILAKLLSLVSNLVRECLDKLTAIATVAGEEIAITGYSIGVGIGGYLTFGINFAPI